MREDLQQRNRNYFEFGGPDSYPGILFISWSGTETSSDLHYSPRRPRIPVLSRGSLLCSSSLLVQVTELCWRNHKVCSMRIQRDRVDKALSKFWDGVCSLKTHQVFCFWAHHLEPLLFTHLLLTYLNKLSCSDAENPYVCRTFALVLSFDFFFSCHIPVRPDNRKACE